MLGDRLRTYRSDIPSLPLLSLLDLGRAISKLDSMVKSVDPADPAGAKNAARLDSETLEEWKQRYLRTAHARSMVDVAAKAVFAVEPRQLSFLFFLTYLRAGGGLLSLTAIREGAQETRVAEGFQTVSVRLAEKLGNRVRLSTPVVGISQDADGVEVHCGGERVRAAHAIVAIPPALAARIEYDPPLPAARDQLTQRMPMGSIIKCIAFYERPFWRDDGFSGEAVLDGGPVRVTFDDSPADARSGALLAFVAGDDAIELSGYAPEARRHAVLEVLGRLFGARARTPVAYVDQDWCAEPYSRGCYTGVLGPGVLTRFGAALRAPVGRIHWAGTESATQHMGYMEGALESGARAAAEVLASPR